MKNKDIIFASDNMVLELKKLKVLFKEKEDIRKKLEVTAKKLAVTAKKKEFVRRKLVVIAKEKERVRRKLVVTAKKLEELRETLEKKVLERTKDIKQDKIKDEALLESIGDGVVATDQNGKVIVINKSAEDLLGVTKIELIGKSFIRVVSQEDAQGNKIPDKLRPITLALSSEATTTTITTATYYFVRKNGTKFPAAITVTPFILDLKTVGAIIVFRDITKEKEIDKAKTEFVSLASHQLRTPLTTVSWYAEMILKGDVGKIIPEQRKYLEEIYRGNQRMIELVNTLLDVSRIELGTFIIKPTLTDIIALAQSVADEQKPEIKKKKLIIVENFSQDVPVFSTDPKLLRMIFQNLLINAVEYTPPGGKIEFGISLDKGKKEIQIKISDTGYGIPKDQQHKIFTKLFRADNVREKDTDGTGLGLYIVKSIVENFGGKIWFESEENKGTTFYVTLPLEGVKKSSEGGSASGGKKGAKALA